MAIYYSGALAVFENIVNKIWLDPIAYKLSDCGLDVLLSARASLFAWTNTHSGMEAQFSFCCHYELISVFATDCDGIFDDLIEEIFHLLM